MEKDKNSSLKSQSYLINPMDFIGIHHNNALDYIGRIQDLPNMTEEEIIDSLNNFSEYPFSDLNLNYQEYLQSKATVEDLISSPSTITSKLMNNEIITDTTKLYLDSLISILIISLDDQLEEPISVSTFNGYIQTYIEYLHSNFIFPVGSLSDSSNIAFLLATASIAKYSYQYWYNAYSDKDNPWHFYFKEEKSTNCNKLGKLFRKIWADVTGFFNSSCIVKHYQDPTFWFRYNLDCGVDHAIRASNGISS
ncbi:MAG: hypothetical protein NTW49_12205 [Bacteroidia bacterium]|nr:hypothetical protein [Bacteroidia bacterium]